MKIKEVSVSANRKVTTGYNSTGYNFGLVVEIDENESWEAVLHDLKIQLKAKVDSEFNIIK